MSFLSFSTEFPFLFLIEFVLSFLSVFSLLLVFLLFSLGGFFIAFVDAVKMRARLLCSSLINAIYIAKDNNPTIDTLASGKV